LLLPGGQGQPDVGRQSRRWRLSAAQRIA
jgi:hypothetical protein